MKTSPVLIKLRDHGTIDNYVAVMQERRILGFLPRWGARMFTRPEAAAIIRRERDYINLRSERVVKGVK